MSRQKTTLNKCYSELSKLKTFDERFDYLKLSGIIGEKTFGSERYLNQRFYGSNEWRAFRREAIIRDNGCDLGIADREIGGRIEIHHLNPITPEDIEKRSSVLMDLENAICVSSLTHKAIHYGDISLIPHDIVERRPNDMCPWKQ